MTDNCVFCEIVAGNIPSAIVAQNDEILAFRDIEPAAPIHILLIPKRHIADSAAGLTREQGALLGKLFELAARIANEFNLNTGWRIVSNVGQGAGQTVFHLHFHLLGGWNENNTGARIDKGTGS